MAKLSVRDIDLKGKRVFMRVDFNVPLSEDGQTVTSDKRIRAALPTIQYVLEKGAGLVLASHLGRPKGKRVPEMSLAPAARRLQEILGRPVRMAPDCIGEEVQKMLPAPGEILLLENTRYYKQEEANDPEFSRKLAEGCDLFVQDAFGSAHRAHASTVGVTRYLQPAAAGFLMDKELEFLGKATTNPERPCVAILGGAKVSDKIEVIQNLMKLVDKLLIGGAMAYTFLKAKAQPTGKSLVEEDKLDLARDLMEKAGDKLVLPVDHVVTAELTEGGEQTVVDSVPDGKMAVDIGPKTAAAYAEVIGGAKTIIWNGPMGVFEKKPYDAGTVAVARAVASSGAVSVVGGGDSEKAVKAAGVTAQISHISTGGGASLEFLSGIELPGVAALTEK